jgi:Restriction endonuclease
MSKKTDKLIAEMLVTVFIGTIMGMFTLIFNLLRFIFTSVGNINSKSILNMNNEERNKLEENKFEKYDKIFEERTFIEAEENTLEFEECEFNEEYFLNHFIGKKSRRNQCEKPPKVLLEEEKSRLLDDKERAKEFAEKRTIEAKEHRESLLAILSDGYGIYTSVDWNKYKIYSDFKDKSPVMIEEILPPSKPDFSDFEIKLTFVDALLKSRKEKVKEYYEKLYLKKVSEWEDLLQAIANKNHKNNELYSKAFISWEERKNIFNNRKNKNNRFIEKKRHEFELGMKEGIEFYFSLVLKDAEYPEILELDFQLEYNEQSKILLVDFGFPSIEEIPNLKNMRYIASRKEFSETYITEKELNRLYESILYQFSLRVNYDLYTSDDTNVLESIVFNGWLTQINRASGKLETKCLLSLQTKKDSFVGLELDNVEPKVCFTKLKGVSSGKLSDFIPIAPIMSLNKEDKRFIESNLIEGKISGQNVAELGWEEFEHLVRELFEKEFSQNGSEVRITQSSRDGGVDAIMFDPDPIRGGKFVIQAKRYTNVVGVSAVRDLYGTVMNEGASKGILVTTANFGADSYEFAKDKPLTLLNGNNLLHLLNKHGYNARIDIVEARRNMGL